MNLIDAVVTEVLSLPYQKYDYWWVDVNYKSYGVPGKTALMFKTISDAEKVQVGYEFLT